MQSHKAADFINADGEHIECFQLLNDDKVAVAIADARNGKIERFDYSRDFKGSVEANKWLINLMKTYTIK
jgi:hypothetical protein